MKIGRVPSERKIVSLGDLGVATSGTAILAMRGAGKSWLNALLAEGLGKARIPFVIIDPEGEYWTLKIGFPDIVITGGDHADLPIDVSIAREIADCLIEERLELVLDISDLKRSEQMLFLSGFLEELFIRETRERIPLWVSFEEADIWIPQGGNTVCKDRVLDICQRGRKRGLGFSLVTQRPAIIDKTALSQTEIRFFKRFQQPQDLNAVKTYLGGYASEVKALPSLRSNEALLYAPTLFDRPEIIAVDARKTPHGGVTPEQIAELKSTTKIVKLGERFRDIVKKKKLEMDRFKILEAKVEMLEQEITDRDGMIEKLRMAQDVAKLLAANVEEHGSTELGGSPVLREVASSKSEDSFRSADVQASSDKIQNSVNDGLQEAVNVYGVDIRTGLIIGDAFSDFLLNRLTPNQRRAYLTVKKSARPVNVSEIESKTGIGEEKLRSILRKLKEMKAILIVKNAGRGKNFVASSQEG